MLFKKEKSSFDFLIVGLGNPGLQYEKTRHNAGFMAIDILAEKLDCEFNKNKFDGLFGFCEIGDKRVILLKPQTYMNLSGKSVLAVAAFYKIPLSNVIVIFDDISLDVGRLRIRRNGSAGGHNGIKDIMELAGTEEIARIKIGVGKKPHPDYDLKDWVLGKISEEDWESFEKALKSAARAAETIVKNGIDTAMNRYNK